MTKNNIYKQIITQIKNRSDYITQIFSFSKQGTICNSFNFMWGYWCSIQWKNFREMKVFHLKKLVSSKEAEEIPVTLSVSLLTTIFITGKYNKKNHL